MTEKYIAVTRGHGVYSRSMSGKKDRKCLTTRSDGHIDMISGRGNDGKNYLNVKIN